MNSDRIAPAPARRPGFRPGRLAALALALALTPLAGAADKNEDKDRSDKPERRTRVRFGGLMVSAGYARYGGYSPWYRPYYYSPYYAGYGPYWSPFWDVYMPLYYPGFYPRYSREAGPGMGEVKLDAPRRAEVYLDGAYAGLAKDLKSMWLEPGAYDLEIRSATDKFSRRIYVLSGKRLRIEAPEGAEP